MSKLERQLREDRLLRNAAKTLFDADLNRVKSDLGSKKLGERALLRARDGASELLETAGDKAKNNVGILALLFGAIALWFARNPLFALLADDNEDNIPHPDTPFGDDQ